MTELQADLLALWQDRALPVQLSFKLQWASLTGGELAFALNSHCPYPNISNINLDVILFIEGLNSESPVRFLLDSGAAVSVIKQDSFPKQSHSDITETKTSAVTANGTLLNVVGKITVTDAMERFTCDHTFVVINNVTVDCLLGADFLRKHEEILDCQNGTLVLYRVSHYPHSCRVFLHGPNSRRSNIEIEVCTIQLMHCKVNGNFDYSTEVIEPPVQVLGCLSICCCSITG